MSRYLFGLYICYWCSVLQNCGDFFVQFRVHTYFIADFSVIVTFLRLSGEEKGASGHPSLQERERHL